MANKLYDEASIQAIADAIRAKNESTDTYYVSEMADAILGIKSGGASLAPMIERSVTEIVDDTVTQVGDYAFAYWRNLDTVSLSNVKRIGRHAFCGCEALKNVSIPDSLEVIGDWAFADCYALQYNEYNNGKYLGNSNNPYLVLCSCVDGSAESLVISDRTKFIYDGALGMFRYGLPKNLTIPDSIVRIGRSALDNCIDNVSFSENNNGKYLGNSNNPYLVLCKTVDKSITTFEIPNSTKFLYEYAFYDCSALTDITLPDGFIGIGEQAFRSCTSLTSIIIPDSVTYIDGYAFSGCSSLTSVTIGKGIKELGRTVFEYCSNLSDIYYDGTIAEWKAIDTEGIIDRETTVHCTDGDTIASYGSND